MQMFWKKITSLRNWNGEMKIQEKDKYHAIYARTSLELLKFWEPKNYHEEVNKWLWNNLPYTAWWKKWSPELEGPVGKLLEWDSWASQLSIGVCHKPRPRHYPLHKIFFKGFKCFWGPNHWVLSKVLSLNFVQRWILGGIAVSHAQIRRPSPKLVLVFFVVLFSLGHSHS